MYINAMPIARGFLPLLVKFFVRRFFDKTAGSTGASFYGESEFGVS